MCLGCLSLKSFEKPLSAEEEKEILERLYNGDNKARDILVEKNMRLVAHMTKKYSTPDRDVRDLISVGTVGLIKAINSFKPDKGIRFATYAAKCIDNELLMMLRSEKKKSREVSIYEPIGTDKEGNEISIIEIVSDEEKDIVEDCIFDERIACLYKKMGRVLNKREMTVISERYGLFGNDEKTQCELAKELGISRSYVSRIEKKALEKLKMEDKLWEENTIGKLSADMPLELQTFELPPLSVFLDAVTENATVKRAQSEVEQVKNEYRLQKRDWWNYFKLNGNYSYGKYNVLSNASDEYTPMYQTTMSNAQHSFSVGASVGISFGDLINRQLKLKKYKYDIEQLQYTQEEVMEERRLRVLEAYNAVTEQMSTIKAKAETAALYNAQTKILENDFIQGKIEISTLSIERARRTGAVTSYEQARVTLHNSVILLEMLTNIKIIKEK